MRKETFTSKTLAGAEEEMNQFVQQKKHTMKSLRRLAPYRVGDTYYVDIVFEERPYRVKTKFN